MMRYTLVDPVETVSFIEQPYVLKALAACCALGHVTVQDIFGKIGFYDVELGKRLRDQLRVFREHNVEGDTIWIDEKLSAEPAYGSVVAVVSDATRLLSFEPAELGLVVFNLNARRIVQVQNTYANLERTARGRVRREGKPTATYFSYYLPDEWTIVP